MLDDFHFIRPFLLPLILLPLIVGILLWRTKDSIQHWQGFVDKAMLSHLVIGDSQQRAKWPITGLCLGWLVACIAIAGPSWEKLPQPQFVNQQPLVVIVDLSPSLLVEDIKPSRLARMRFKLIDLLKARKQGLTALVVYAGDSHILAPLSDDTQTLISLVPTLSPQVMPISGSNTEEAIEQGLSLLQDQGFQSASILLFTDGVTEQAQANINRLLADKAVNLSIIGVGSEQGAPIPISSSGFAKDEQGNIVLAKLESAQLKALAEKNRGVYSQLTLSDEDINQVLAQLDTSGEYQQLSGKNTEMDEWLDAGQWLALLVLPVVLLSFRRGMLLQLALVSALGFSLSSPKAMAFDWQDLWKTKDQQAAIALANGDYEQAAQSFSDPKWRAISQYKANDFAAAAASFAEQADADSYYNQGNTLAQQGELADAIKAYDQALQLEPDMQDAIFNKKIVADMLRQQEEQKNTENSKDNSDKQKNENQKSDSQENQNQKNDSQENENQKNQNQNSDNQNTSSAEENADSQADKSAENQRSQNNSDSQQSEAGDQQNQQNQQNQADQKQTENSTAQNSKEKQSDKERAEQLQNLKEQRRAQEQQAIESKQQELADQDSSSQDQEAQAQQLATSASKLTREQQLEQEQLNNWLGQLPEDASLLMRNKFNYELQKKRQAYRNGQWQPTKEQRW